MTINIPETTESMTDYEAAVKAVLVKKKIDDEAGVEKMLTKFLTIFEDDLSADEVQIVRDNIFTQMGIQMDIGTALAAKGHEPWLSDYKMEVGELKRAATYRQWLVTDEGYSPIVVNRMDELTDDILDLAGDPNKDGLWKRRGVVLGDVQSGKTATYLSLFNKAIDVGYRLIIVLGGHTELLRKQTQRRVDTGVIGRKTPKPKTGASLTVGANEPFVGVGKLDKDDAKKIQRLTSEWSDFSSSKIQGLGLHLEGMEGVPFIFVVKKNKAILTNLMNWLSEQASTKGKLDFPLLLLDDESDYASVNTREEDDPTVINELIRGLLAQSDRSSYLGFSATPFANIFIDSDVEDDLFPRDYIYSLEAPSNYVGGAKVFAPEEGIDVDPVVPLVDAERFFPPKHKASLKVQALPESLKLAIRAFLVANAIRDLRGQVSMKRSMMVNVSRFIAVQDQVHKLVAAELLSLKNAVELHAKTFQAGLPNEELSSLQYAFDEFYADLEYDWNEVVAQLPASVSGIQDRIINSSTDKKLLEGDSTAGMPDRQIVIGGDVLSRGLTLEGLTISYFYRQVVAADTLLQMARWFGYRPGYEDLCKVWIATEQADNYAFVDRSVKELRSDLSTMRDVGLTPSEFGLAVRKHPGALLVTARNKMKSAQKVANLSVSFRGRAPETTKLSSDKAVMKSNYDAAAQLFKALASNFGNPEHARPNGKGAIKWREVDRTEVAKFLDEYQAHHSDPAFALGKGLSDHVAVKSPHAAWDVIINVGSGNGASIGGIDVQLTHRKLELAGDLIAVSGGKRRLAGPGDLKYALDEDVASALETAYLSAHSSKSSVPDAEYLGALDRPVLVLYPLAQTGLYSISQSGKPVSLPVDENISAVIGIRLAFPGGALDPNDTSDDVEYVVNKVLLKNMLGADDLGSGDE